MLIFWPATGNELYRGDTKAEEPIVQPCQRRPDKPGAETDVSVGYVFICVADDWRSGNLSQRSLLEVVNTGDLVEDSEFLETLLVAVPKNLAKDWDEKYERLTSMVVPRSTQ